jgi:hypothetical protein
MFANKPRTNIAKFIFQRTMIDASARKKSRLFFRRFSIPKAINAIVLVSLIVTSCAPRVQSTNQNQTDSASATNPLPQAPVPQTSIQDNRIIPTFERPEPRLVEDVEENSTVQPESLASRSQTNNNDLSTSVVFMENVGQFDPRARFQAQSGDVTLYFSDDSIWLTLLEPVEDNVKPSHGKFNNPSPQQAQSVKPQKGVNIKINLVGSNAHPLLEPFGRLETNYSYFIGRNADDWHVDIPVWQGFRYKDIYPGLDLEITSAGGQYEWQFIITDQGLFNENRQLMQNGIRVQVNGHQKLGLNQNVTDITTEVGSILLPEFRFDGQIVEPEIKNNELVIPISQRVSYLEMTKWVAYQQPINDSKPTTSVTNVLSQTNYLSGTPLLSPSEALLYSTYLGGGIPRYSPVYTNTSADDIGADIAISGDYVYIAGLSQSADFPNSTGTFTVKFGETSFAQAYSPYRPFVAKLNATTNQFVYVDYFNLGAPCSNPVTGGVDFKSGAFHALSVDSSGNVYVGGTTVNFEFPLTANALDTTISEQCWFSSGGSFLTLEGFITKIDPSGTQLLYASYFGGSSQENITNIENDESGNVYIVGNTYSTDMPVGGTVYDGTHNGRLDIFVTKINTISGQQAYFSYLGGNDNDDPLGTTLSQDGTFYISGRTWSNNFTATTPGSAMTCSTCPSDGFVLKMNAGGGVDYARYLGGTGGDLVSSLAIDQNNHAFVAGYTSSTDFPVTTTKTDTDVYLAELDTNGSLLYSQRFGGSSEEGYYYFGYDIGGGIALDNEGKVYIVGTTLSTDFPVTLTGYDQDRDQSASNQDLFITKIDPKKIKYYIAPIWAAVHTKSPTQISL